MTVPVLVAVVTLGAQICKALASGGTSVLEESERSSAVENQVAKCKAPGGEAAAVRLSASISEAQNTLTLACSGDSGAVVVPGNLTNGAVCVSEAEREAALAACEAAARAEARTEAKVEAIKVSQLLETEKEILWTMAEQGTTGYRLTIGEEDFPSKDKKFFVGCKSASPPSECLVQVTVKAKASVVVGQVATCAYGESSNALPLDVTVTQARNTFTLVCGAGGTSRPEPTRIKTEFCVGNDVSECETTSAYGSILPGFKSEWWSAEPKGNQHVLKIPPENFPAKEQSFLVGCVASTETEAKSKSSACSVKVTVRPNDGGSSAAGTAVAFYIAVLAGTSFSLF